MTAYLLTIGDELLIGQVVNTNSAWLAAQLNREGVRITGHYSVGDTHDGIIAAIREGLQHADIVITTGGLGATKDDITKRAIAALFGVEMVIHEDTLARITGFFARLGRTVSEMNRQGCLMPTNAQIMTNEVGLAPGMWFETAEGGVVVSMPGVPFEMQRITTDHLLPRLQAYFRPSPIAHRTILTAGAGETQLAEWVSDFEEALPPSIKLAYLPALGTVRLRLTATGDNQSEIEQLLDEKVAALLPLISHVVAATEDISLAKVIGNMLLERGLTFGTAESCTGGYVAHLMTAVAGSSAYFSGGVVAYSNVLKTKLLGVSAKTLEVYGAVSEETVCEMAVGTLDALGVDVSVAISGIAGPNGGTKEKPVGTVWIAVAHRDGRVKSELFKAFRDRQRNIESSGYAALNLVRKFLKN